MNRWTDAYIKKLVPPAGKSPARHFEDAADAALRGFGVRVTPKGVRSFFVAYTSPQDGKRRTMALGKYPTTSLAAARERCREARGLVEQGIDPLQNRDEATRQRKEDAQREARMGTVADLFDLYIGQLERDGRRSAVQVRSIYKRDIAPRIGQKRARDITGDDIADVLAATLQRAQSHGKTGATLANRVRSYLRAAFELGREVHRMPQYRGSVPVFDIGANPVEGVARPAKREAPRDRVLSVDELRTLWRTLGNARPVSVVVRGHAQTNEAKLDPLTVCAVRWLIASGQRVEEVMGARWDEFDRGERVWTIPAERRKNRQYNVTREPHIVPLTSFHLALLDEIAALRVDGTPWLFPSLSAPAERPRRADGLGQAVRRWCDRVGFERFQPRDLRRTFKTLAGRAGVDLEIRNRLQGHAMQDVGSRHYDRWGYLPEKRAGMERWAAWLETTLAGESATVVPLELRHG